MSEVQTLFAKRLHDLRRLKGWSQPEVGKLIGTSGAIIGRYERAEMMPSIEVAKKLAQAFEVTLDYLVSPNDQPNLVQDKSMLERIRAINDLSGDERERLLYVVDGVLRDARARRAYASV
ncbi:MAG: helix-turn-helix transcriptional regulator [Rhodoferax sp.]|nr:helix-turn-helix transcriptional regulator [Rhodoferax sp.]